MIDAVIFRNYFSLFTNSEILKKFEDLWNGYLAKLAELILYFNISYLMSSRKLNNLISIKSCCFVVMESSIEVKWIAC